MENLIVALIIAAAGVFAVYRLFFRPQCGCGSDCGCSAKPSGRNGHCASGDSSGCSSRGSGGCNCRG